MLRATWLAQELLHTFSDDIESVNLCPATGGYFEIFCNDTSLWERKAEQGFPDAKTLKQRLRDHIDPLRQLGHIDR